MPHQIIKLISVLGLITIIIFSQCSTSNGQNESMKGENINITDSIKQEHLLATKATRVKDMMNFYSGDTIQMLIEKVIRDYKKITGGNELDPKLDAVYIFKYSTVESLSKTDLKRNTFYKKLCPYNNQHFNKSGLLFSSIILINQDNKAVARGGYLMTELYNNQVEYLSYDQFVLDKKKELKIEYLFSITSISPPTIIFGLSSDSTIYVFPTNSQKLEVLSIDEFLKTRPDEIFKNK